MKEVGRFPVFLAETIWGLIISVTTNLESLTLAVFALCVGYGTHSVFFGVAAFFGIYSVLRTISFWIMQLCNNRIQAARVTSDAGVSGQRSDGNA